MSDDGWQYSTEGDLDPDLVEEAGYSSWSPPDRRWQSILLRISIALVLVCFLVALLLQVIHR